MISLAKALRKLHSKAEEAQAEAILAANGNPVQGQTVDVLALQHQEHEEHGEGE